MAGSPSGLLSLHRKSAFSSPEPQKLGAFFILGPIATFSGDLHVPSSGRRGARPPCSPPVLPPAPSPRLRTRGAGRPRQSAAQVRPRSRRLRSQRSPAGRPLPLRRRRLARQHADSRGSFQLRLVHHPRRPGAGRGEAAHRRGRPRRRIGPRVRTRRRSATSTLAYMDTARVGEPRALAAERRAGAHRRDRHAARCGALHRLLAAHRRRAAVRLVLGRRTAEFDRLSRRAVPERAHHARP